jgi:ubiquinone/menaquinone biosynthesis C-methylase UbiE
MRRLVRDGYDEIAARYLAARPVDSADVALLDDLTRRLSRDELVLDAGCGAGMPITTRLVQAGFTVVGLDFSATQLSLARSLVPEAHLVQADLSALPYADRSFGAVVSYYAAIHVPRGDHQAMLEETRRVTRPRGLALLCLGAGDLPADHDPESWLGTPMYWSHFDAATNRAMLRAAGFDIVWARLVADPMDHGRHLFTLAARS